MFVQLAFFSYLFAFAFSAPNPTGPGPSDTFAAGSQCTIQWTPDSTGKWTNMNIELMTGPNAQMIHLRTLTTVNAVTNTSYSWTCPEIIPPGPIVFYQFTDQDDPSNTVWTGRFTITDANGTSDPAPYTDDKGIAYGNATFEDTSLYNAPPPYLAGNGEIVQTAGPSTGGPSILPSPSTIPVTEASSISSQSMGGVSTVMKPLSSSGTTKSTGTGTGTGTSTSTSTTSSQPGAALALSVPNFTYSLVAFGASMIGIAITL